MCTVCKCVVCGGVGGVGEECIKWVSLGRGYVLCDVSLYSLRRSVYIVKVYCKVKVHPVVGFVTFF